MLAAEDRDRLGDVADVAVAPVPIRSLCAPPIWMDASSYRRRSRGTGRPRETQMDRNQGRERATTAERAPIATYDVRGGGGVTLHSREWGDRTGPSILFVHGWSQSQLCWSRQTASDLASTFRIVTFDIRGHGMSEKPPEPEQYTDPQVWADDLAAIIQQTGLRSAGAGCLVIWRLHRDRLCARLRRRRARRNRPRRRLRPDDAAQLLRASVPDC